MYIDIKKHGNSKFYENVIPLLFNQLMSIIIGHWLKLMSENIF